MEKDSQFIDIFHGFLSRHVVDDGFTHRRKVSSCDHVMKLTSHAPGEHTVFSEEGVVFFGSIDLQLYQHLDEIRIARLPQQLGRLLVPQIPPQHSGAIE